MFAAGGIARLAFAALLEAREVAVHQLQVAGDGAAALFAAVFPRISAGQQVFFHAQMLKTMAPLHHLHHATANQFGRGELVDPLALVFDRAFGHRAPLSAEDVGNRLDGGGLAGPIGAHQRDDPAFGHIQRDALEHQDDVIVDHLDIFYAQDDVVIGRHDKARQRMARERMPAQTILSGHSLRSAEAGNT